MVLKSKIQFMLILTVIFCCFIGGRASGSINNEKNINFKIELSKENELISPGESIKVTVKAQNVSNDKIEGVKVKLLYDGDCDIIGIEEKEIKTLEPNKIENLKWAVKCKSGGVRLYLVITNKDGESYELNGKGVTVGGEGWFSGDTHTHSKFSDGYGTVKDNITELKNKGLNFIAITDHNNYNALENVGEICSEDKIIIGGNEYTTVNGHGVIMNINENKDYSNMTKEELSKYIKATTDNNGLIYAAHPYEAKGAWEFEVCDGIEVWNGWYGPKHPYNKYAFEKWDELNKKGKKVYGISDTDAHSSSDIGKNFTTVFAKDFTSKDIINGYLSGNMYGSNGPTMEFNINSKIMGEDVILNPNGEKVVVRMKGAYHKKLSKVVLIKNGEEIYVEEIDDYEFSIRKNVEVKPGDVLRMEIVGFEDKGHRLDSENKESAPFAFSNPIFMK